MEYTVYGRCGTPHVLNPSVNYGALDIMYTDYEKWQNYVINNYNKERQLNTCFDPLACDFKRDESKYMLRKMLLEYISQSSISSQFERPVLDRHGIIRIAPKNLNVSVISDIKSKL